jgi:hypothetical protein
MAQDFHSGSRFILLREKLMPLKKCKTKTGKSGTKYGNSGKCYAERSKAIKQMKAIKASQKK